MVQEAYQQQTSFSLSYHERVFIPSSALITQMLACWYLLPNWKEPNFLAELLGKALLVSEGGEKKKKKVIWPEGTALINMGDLVRVVYTLRGDTLIHASPSAHSSGWMFLMVLGPFHIRHYCNLAIKAQHSRSRWGFLGESAHTFLLNKKHSLRLQKSLPPST